MTGGAPHCETIKIQMECHSCGHYENEYYTPEEMKVNSFLEATGASVKDCREALEASDYNIAKAEKYLDNRVKYIPSMHPRPVLRQ
jgi:hypothetical protein